MRLKKRKPKFGWSSTEGDAVTIKTKKKTKAFEDMADEIRKLGEGVRAMMDTGLQRRTIVLLLQDASGVPIRQIQAVLNALESIDTRYTKKRSSPF